MMRTGELSIKDAIKMGIIFGFLMATVMQLYDYFNKIEFSILKWFVSFIVLGLVMTIVFNNKHKLE